MSVNYESYFRGADQRAEAREALRCDRERQARALVPHLGRILVERWGATRVVLFGSLAEGFFDVSSDIDLAVEGIEGSRFFRAAADLDDAARPFRVDLVPLEDAFESLRAKIARTGEIVDVTA